MQTAEKFSDDKIVITKGNKKDRGREPSPTSKKLHKNLLHREYCSFQQQTKLKQASSQPEETRPSNRPGGQIQSHPSPD